MPEPLSYTIQFTDGSSRTVNHASVPDINDEFILFANQDRRVIGVFPLHSIKESYSAAADVPGSKIDLVTPAQLIQFPTGGTH